MTQALSNDPLERVVAEFWAARVAVLSHRALEWRLLR